MKAKYGHLKPATMLNSRFALCICDCEEKTEFVVPLEMLEKGLVTSCGCAGSTQLPSGKSPSQYKGQVFGKLTVTEYLGSRKWLAKCECGNDQIVYSFNLNHKDASRRPTMCNECKAKAKA